MCVDRNLRHWREKRKQSQCGDALISCHESFDAANVAAALGSGMDACARSLPKRPNSRRLPWVTAAASSAPKSQKKRNGVDAPNSSPMNNKGGDGARSTQAIAARNARGGAS